MERLFYSTGQVAHRLGITLAAVRVLCENGLITAETTPGGHWRVPASEVERIKREGVPPIPRPLPIEKAPTQKNGTCGYDHAELAVEPSGEVLSAADQVTIARSILEKRKLDRQIEEVEDGFRDRERRQAAEEAAERQTIEANQRRIEWMHQWMQYALNSVPCEARREVEMEVHATVEEVLSMLEFGQPAAITQKLVDAAVHRALRPWSRKRHIERAIEAGMNRLAWDVRYGLEYLSLNRRAWDAAVSAVRTVCEEATYHEMELAAMHAVEPMMLEYEHQQASQRIIGRVYIFEATREEREEAKSAVSQALAALPIGAATKELEKAGETALKPHQAAVLQRKENERLELENQARRRTAGWKVELELGHIARYLEQEYEFDGGHLEMRREADRLRPLIRETMIDRLTENPDMSSDEIRKGIERQVDNCL